MRSVVLCLWILLQCGCVGAQSSGDSLGMVFRSVRSSVVVVLVEKRELSPLPSRGGKDDRFVEVGGLGSGVLVRDGERLVVMTAAHTVQAADRVQVRLADGRSIGAKVVTSAQLADVALLELETAPKDVAAAKLGDSDAVRVGDPVFVVGAPYGLEHTLTAGHVSARRRSKQVLGGMSTMELFQTDAAINSGNSGGPMFNSRGEVIGIVSHILSRSGGFEGLGFAVTTKLARRLLFEEPTGWWGVEGFVLSGDLAKIFNLPQTAGLLVQRIAKSSAGERFGLRPGVTRAQIGNESFLVGGDIILAVQDVKLDASAKSIDAIREKLRAVKTRDVVALKVLREGKVIELTGVPKLPEVR